MASSLSVRRIIRARVGRERERAKASQGTSVLDQSNARNSLSLSLRPTYLLLLRSFLFLSPSFYSARSMLARRLFALYRYVYIREERTRERDITPRYTGERPGEMNHYRVYLN